MYGLIFEWDPKKARRNLEKHGISFEEASTVFGDPNAITIYDDEHSDDEDREITIGFSAKVRIIVVSHTDRDGKIRIINARKATRTEILQVEGN